jgi:hypothetical protein
VACAARDGGMDRLKRGHRRGRAARVRRAGVSATARAPRVRGRHRRVMGARSATPATAV